MDDLSSRLKRVTVGTEARRVIEALCKRHDPQLISDIIESARRYLRLNACMCPIVEGTNVQFYESRRDRTGLKLKFFLHVNAGTVEIAGIREDMKSDP